MKTLLVAALFGITLSAEESDWEILRFSSSDTGSDRESWTFTFRNRTDRTIEVWESWSGEGEAMANLYTTSLFGGGMKLFAEPCHPKGRVTVKPGGTILASLPALSPQDIVPAGIRVAIVVDGKPVVVESLANLKKKGQQDGTGQPATRPESNSEGSEKPQPEAEGRSR